ncbi:MAG: rhamnogalacturonan lyase family protein [Planctomycetota bacterium]|jgi:hypothetical protein
MRASVLCLGILGVSATAFAAELSVTNASFEEADGRGARGWHWWSRTEAGSAVRVSDERHSGKSSVRISHDGERDWAFPSDHRFEARSGQSYLASAWVKVKTGHIELAVVALEKGKTLSWDIGSRRSGPTDAWRRIEAVVDVPERCDAIYVRFIGDGETLAWVDDVALEAWKRPAPEAKPKVQGHARVRVRERLDRGIVALPVEGGAVYIGWRLLDDDAARVAFNVFRRTGRAPARRVNTRPITRTTDFVDRKPAPGEHAYFVRVVRGRRAGLASREARVVAGDEPKPYVSIKLDGDHTFQKAGIADLDGDGRYDFVLKQPKDNIDPYDKYWRRSPDTYKLEAYRHDGKLLWRHDLGWAIERGIWYSPYVVHDLDGDGRAEVAVKTGEGDPRDEDGRVRSGPEYLSVLDGLTGKTRARVEWPSREGFGSGLRGYNYASRNQLGVAYLDGKTPCVIVERGTYNLIKLVAYEFHGRQLRELWRWSNDDRGVRRSYWGQGAHRMHAADVDGDGDGRDEVIIGSAAIDDNGSELWTTGLGHPDHFYLGDIDPARPGPEIYYGIESRRRSRNGMCLVDAKTGNIIWGHEGPTRHVHGQGLCSDIDPRHPGAECYAADTDERKKLAWARLYSAKGEVVNKDSRWGFAPRAAYWDADLQREVLHKGKLADYGKGDPHVRVEGHVAAVADILGDWREETITSVAGEMRIYTTTIPAADRRPCLMQDPLYRADVTTNAMGYFQVPMTSYDLQSRAEAPGP